MHGAHGTGPHRPQWGQTSLWPFYFKLFSGLIWSGSEILLESTILIWIQNKQSTVTISNELVMMCLYIKLSKFTVVALVLQRYLFLFCLLHTFCCSHYNAACVTVSSLMLWSSAQSWNLKPPITIWASHLLYSSVRSHAFSWFKIDLLNSLQWRSWSPKLPRKTLCPRTTNIRWSYTLFLVMRWQFEVQDFELVL